MTIWIIIFLSFLSFFGTLTDLWVDECENLTLLLERMHTLLPSLRELRLSGVQKLSPFLREVCSLVCLHFTIYIGGCNKLLAHRREWHLKSLSLLYKFWNLR